MFLRYEGIAWEQRFLPRLTSGQIAQLPKEKALVVLSIGAVEQHGPHLPVMTDALIGEAALTRAMEKIGDKGQIWLIPPLSYGKSNEHIGHAGTISLSAATLLSVLSDIAESLKASGFRRLLLFNTHGGNKDLLHVAARDIRISTGLMVFCLSPGSLNAAEGLVSPEEMEYGIHGGDYETSVVMAVKPEWVRSELRPCEIPDLSPYRYLTMEGNIRFAWVMKDISESGVLGDATLATAEKGAAIQERTAEVLAEVLLELCNFELEDFRKR